MLFVACDGACWVSRCFVVSFLFFLMFLVELFFWRFKIYQKAAGIGSSLVGLIKLFLLVLDLCKRFIFMFAGLVKHKFYCLIILLRPPIHHIVKPKDKGVAC